MFFSGCRVTLASIDGGVWCCRFTLATRSLFGGIWDASLYLAICANLFETYRILHRVGALFAVLWFHILICRCLGFIVHTDALLICVSRLGGVEGFLAETFCDDKDTTPASIEY